MAEKFNDTFISPVSELNFFYKYYILLNINNCTADKAKILNRSFAIIAFVMCRQVNIKRTPLQKSKLQFTPTAPSGRVVTDMI